MGVFKKAHVYALLLLQIKSYGWINLKWCLTLLYFNTKAEIKSYSIDECSKCQKEYGNRLSAGTVL